MDLQELSRSVVDPRTKGIPGHEPPFPLHEIGDRGWNVLAEDLPLPLAILKEPALEHNLRWMADFLDDADALLAPHGKTTMAPQLFRRQLEHGAWGITLANVAQIQVARHYGVRRIFLANQLVGRQAISYVARELEEDPALELLCLVDSVEGVEILADALEARAPGRPLQVLVEGGVAGGRTGARSVDAAMEVARAVAGREPALTLRGVEGFEGLIRGETPEETDRRVARFLDFLVEIAEGCADEELFGPRAPILSAGGSSFYDLVVQRLGAAELGRPHRVLTRSGCYLTHDAGMYAAAFSRILERSPEVADAGPPPRAALEVWCYVQSLPEEGRAILTAGKRDVAFDYGLPIPEGWHRPGREEAPRALGEGYRISALNDQHAYLDVPEGHPLRVGDMVQLGISHPCALFDRWTLIPLVDDGYDVVGAVRTFF